MHVCSPEAACYRFMPKKVIILKEKSAFVLTQRTGEMRSLQKL